MARYNLMRFNKAVAYYKRMLGKKLHKGSTCLVCLQLGNEKAFFSLAPLSRAVHQLGADMSVFVLDRENRVLPVLRKTWEIYSELQQGKRSRKTKALQGFVKAVERKTKSKYIEKLMRQPELELLAGKKGFNCNGELIEFRTDWFRKRRWRQLLATNRRILRQGYGISKRERVSVGFELVPKKKDLELPLDDYLDSFAISYTFALAAAKLCRNVGMGSETSRMSQLQPMERITDLAATLAGCEYEKNIPEPWFRAFRRLSPFIGAKNLSPADASFGIYGKGYGGKHFFGISIGYPTPNRKSRWQSPGQMFLKPWWLEQTKHDARKPLTRHAITETLPIENYIRTCYVDYFALRKKNERIRGVLLKSRTLIVKGVKVKGGSTDLKLDLRHISSRKGPVLGDDIETNPVTPHEAAAIFKTKSGRYGNFPSGEVFFTPHKMGGTFVGDVVIAIDQSYVISENKPLVVKVKNGRYKVRNGSRKILKALNKRKREAWRLIQLFEKNKSMPKKMIESMKQNFDRIGEFAINTNPNAGLSRYLVEAEKIARMIHIALGSGYEPGREARYHCDVVINSPRQKLDIYAIDKKGRQCWIIKKGKMVV